MKTYVVLADALAYIDANSAEEAAVLAEGIPAEDWEIMNICAAEDS